MGCRPIVRILKTRRTATVGEASLWVDEVEGLGSFMELERLVSDDADGEAVQAELAASVAGLGVDAQRTVDTYDSLIRAVTA
jgi:adenylate cyclase class 2